MRKQTPSNLPGNSDRMQAQEIRRNGVAPVLREVFPIPIVANKLLFVAAYLPADPFSCRSLMYFVSQSITSTNIAHQTSALDVWRSSVNLMLGRL